MMKQGLQVGTRVKHAITGYEGKVISIRPLGRRRDYCEVEWEAGDGDHHYAGQGHWYHIDRIAGNSMLIPLPPPILEATLAEAHALLRAFDAIGPNARRVLLAVAKRLVKGANEHGDFEGPKRDMKRETLEELYDAIVYTTIELAARDAGGPETDATDFMEQR